MDCIGEIIGTDRSAMCVEGKTAYIRDTSTVKYSFYYISLCVVSGDCIHCMFDILFKCVFLVCLCYVRPHGVVIHTQRPLLTYSGLVI